MDHGEVTDCAGPEGVDSVLMNLLALKEFGIT